MEREIGRWRVPATGVVCIDQVRARDEVSTPGSTLQVVNCTNSSSLDLMFVDLTSRALKGTIEAFDFSSGVPGSGIKLGNYPRKSRSNHMKSLRIINSSILIATSLVYVGVQGAEPSPGQQVEQSFRTKDSADVRYLLYLPDNYSPAKDRLPVMLFLHGRGESDGPLSVVAKWGPPLLATRGEKFPFILVSPQCPREDSWSSATQQARLTELLDSMIEKYNADKNRVYLSGLSMGGSGSWRMAADHPERFAAVVPICGRGDLKDAAKFKDLPLWVFVGDQDRVFQSNIDMAEAIKKAGSKASRITTLENIGHNSWSAAYASPDLYTWLNQQTRSAN